MELMGSPVPVKRSLQIPENMNWGYIQEELMLAMGWEGHHLKENRCGGISYFTRLADGEDPEEMEGFPQRDSFQYTLGDLLKLPGDTFIYDLGDCPPEDVGGVEGYADMLKGMDEMETDPTFFALHELQNRVVDFQRVIGEAKWGLPKKSPCNAL